MGRQIFVALSYEQEQELVNRVVHDGFVVVRERLPKPRLWEQTWEALPSDDVAEPWDFACALLPAVLARTRQACFVGLASPLDPRPRGSIPPQLAYSVNTSCLPCIEWDRNRRLGPHTVRVPGGGGRLYVDTQRDYGADNHWREAVVNEYDQIVKTIKKWTVLKGKWGYWSRTIDPPPTDEEYERLLNEAKA